MPTEQDMIDRINAECGEGIRLAEHVYISWLEDLGDPRAEAWRVLIEAGKRPTPPSSKHNNGWDWWGVDDGDVSKFDEDFPRCCHVPKSIETVNHEIWWAPSFRTFCGAMNAAAVAWVRCHRDPEFDPLGMMGV